MQVLFIRHAPAMEREEFIGEDLDRPLSEKGEKRAAKAFKTLAGLYTKPNALYTSEAKRSLQTAQLLSQAFGEISIHTSPLLNPGMDYPRFKTLFDDIDKSFQAIAVIGHEPDFSEIISEVVSDGSLHLEVKKASCIEIEMGIDCKGMLKALIPPKVLR